MKLSTYLIPLRLTKPSSLLGRSNEVSESFSSSSTCITYRSLYSDHHLVRKKQSKPVWTSSNIPFLHSPLQFTIEIVVVR